MCPLNATDPLILNAIKNCSLSLSPDSLSRVNKWQRCWRLLLKRLLKDVPLEDNLNIFSSQVKLSLEFTNSLSQLTNNHTSASLLSVARTGLSFFFFFFVAYRGCHNDNIVSLRAVLPFRRRPKSARKKKKKLMLENRKDSSELRAAPWNLNFFHYLFWTPTTDFTEKEALLVIDSILHYSGKIKRQGSVSFA